MLHVTSDQTHVTHAEKQVRITCRWSAAPSREAVTNGDFFGARPDFSSLLTRRSSSWGVVKLTRCPPCGIIAAAATHGFVSVASSIGWDHPQHSVAAAPRVGGGRTQCLDRQRADLNQTRRSLLLHLGGDPAPPPCFERVAIGISGTPIPAIQGIVFHLPAARKGI